MNKKLIAMLLAALFAILFAFPAMAYDGTNTVSRSYTAGYTILNYNYFFTGTLTKTSDWYWLSAKDDNIETVFVKSNGETNPGFHYTSVYCGTTLVSTSSAIVNSGAEVEIFVTYAYRDVGSIRLKINNGASNGEGYRTRGTFKGVKIDPDYYPL